MIPKKWWKEKLFLWNKRINVIFPNEENELMDPNQDKKGNYYENPHLHHCQTNFTFKENGGRKSTLNEQSINFIYPNEENKFMVPNYEKKSDYYLNPWLSN